MDWVFAVMIGTMTVAALMCVGMALQSREEGRMGYSLLQLANAALAALIAAVILLTRLTP